MSPAFELVITVVALACIVIGFNTRRFFFRTAGRTSQNSPASVQLRRWMATNIMSLAYFEACILFGLVLHYLRARVRLVELLFGVGIVSMLVWSPGAPPGTEEPEFPQA